MTLNEDEQMDVVRTVMEKLFLKPSQDKVDPNKCRDCKTKLIITKDDAYVCNNCGLYHGHKLIIGHSDRSRYNKQPSVLYKRKWHFKEILNRIMCIERNTIHNFEEIPKFNNKKKLYKSLNYNQRKHFNGIWNFQHSIKPLKIPYHDFNRLIDFFIKFEKKYQDIYRKRNTINYMWLLIKMCDFLKLDYIKEHIFYYRNINNEKYENIWNTVISKL